MTFPVFIDIGFMKIHPHFLFEALAYFIGARVYFFTRRKEKIPFTKAMSIIAGMTVGAALGSKILYWFEDPVQTMQNLTNLPYLMAGKTIVGGLLGGLIGVELTKKLVGHKSSTGDDFAIPVIVGMAIGRIGCFLTGLSDHTYGIETTWVTGVDFGDGVYRHPTQLYEIGFLMLLTGFLIYAKKKALYPWEGSRFQLFMLGYLFFRFAIDFIKPTPHVFFGMNNIQIACVLGLIYYIQLFRHKAMVAKEMPYAP
ncbi:prolipoprotein diacylglyceryl transferase [Brevibacillus dissolubilis]|uniref:prolipoprotein diacylglyceryl transferase n=1 Tax=Brevibacillus dissolubilis TaxID=1844116 RepID=UPI0011175D02|nr:prolipoprotein diacylglyceryl transferase family protein [Brevibacillus dissolubilis]